MPPTIPATQKTYARRSHILRPVGWWRTRRGQETGRVCERFSSLLPIHRAAWLSRALGGRIRRWNLNAEVSRDSWLFSRC